MTAYQLMADTLDSLDIHNGTMFRFQQNRYKYRRKTSTRMRWSFCSTTFSMAIITCMAEEIRTRLRNLIMGTQDVVISQIMETDRYYYIIGENFTNWSRVFVNDTKVSTKYLSSRLLRIKKEDIPSGDNEVVVNQMGSSDTLFRSSNQMMLTKAEETESESIAAE